MKTTQHAGKLNTIPKLEKLGFEGPDACLATSLFEYGLAWKTEGNETMFIHAVSTRFNEEFRQDEYGGFDRAILDNTMNVFDEFDWVDWDSLFSTNDTTKEQWIELPFEQKIHDLFCHYGTGNVFGVGYEFEIFEYNRDNKGRFA